MDRHELERLRRSVAMLPPGHSAGALSRQQAQDLIDELDRTAAESGRYRAVLDELRRMLAAMDCDPSEGAGGPAPRPGGPHPSGPPSPRRPPPRR